VDGVAFIWDIISGFELECLGKERALGSCRVRPIQLSIEIEKKQYFLYQSNCSVLHSSNSDLTGRDCSIWRERYYNVRTESSYSYRNDLLERWDVGEMLLRDRRKGHRLGHTSSSVSSSRSSQTKPRYV
jgi:hypothetical protein